MFTGRQAAPSIPRQAHYCEYLTCSTVTISSCDAGAPLYEVNTLGHLLHDVFAYSLRISRVGYTFCFYSPYALTQGVHELRGNTDLAALPDRLQREHQCLTCSIQFPLTSLFPPP
jgi:hypothetical protein